ncbi:MAG TPA: GNAT family N-acetyltransferase [Devosiaceae bacterium]|nr:GNAT family N-acetyltransferase [Devosiaceae bacterium]
MTLTVESEFNSRGQAGTAWNGIERRAISRHKLATEKVSPELWDRQAAQFDGAVQEQLAAYARTRWPSAIPEALLFSLDGEVVGGALVMIQRLPLRLGAIAISKWGPILKDAKRSDAGALYAAMIDALLADYAVNRRMMLSVLPRAATGDRNWQHEHLLARRFRSGAAMHFPDRYLVNVRLSDAEQRQSLHQKWRYHLNKADKAGLSFERADVERLSEFDALYQAMIDRKNFPDHSAYDTIAALFAAETPELRPELFFVRRGDDVLAGAIVFKAGDTAVYLFGATKDEALPLRAGYFMQWHIVRWLRDNTKADWYDLGGTEGYQGLHQFKKGLVGDKGIITPVPPVANYAAYTLPRLLGEGAFALRELIQDFKRRRDGMADGKQRSTTAPANEDE